MAEAATDAERSALEARAAVMAHLRHPGIVELIGAGPGPNGRWRLHTRWAGEPLSGLSVPVAPAELAGLGAAVANIVGDLHALGWVHGDIRLDHVLLDSEGRPVVCGMGSARRSEDPAARAVDGSDLIAMLEALIPAGASGGDWRRVRRELRPSGRNALDVAAIGRRLASPRLMPRLLVPEGCAGGSSAAVMAAPRASAPAAPAPANSRLPISLRLSDSRPIGRRADQGGPGSEGDDACVGEDEARVGEDGVAAPGVPAASTGWSRRSEGDPPPDVAPTEAADHARVPAGGSGRGWRPGRAHAAGVAAAIVVALLATGFVAHRSGAVGCPAVDDGCRALVLPGGVLTTSSGRFAVGSAGDQVVLGRWDCGPVGLPAVLDPATSTVWVFDRWPTPGGDVAGRALGRVAGAVTLAVAPNSRGCDGVKVIREGRAAVVLQPKETP